jgi:NhaP-type Na+/H+ or K+/H+ antiporter
MVFRGYTWRDDSVRISETRETFPYRDLIIVTAFGVVLGTLVLQGLTDGAVSAP